MVDDDRPAAPPSWPHAASAAAIGAAVGLLGYRYLALPFTFGGSVGTILTGAGVGLAVASGAVRKQAGDAPRPPLPALALWGALGLAVGGAVAFFAAPPLGRVSLETRALAGLSIDLPSGERRDELDTFEIGKILINKPGGYRAVVAVSWEPGGLLDEEELAMFAAGLAAGAGAGQDAVPAPHIAIGDDLPAQTRRFAGKMQTIMTVLVCDGRRFLVMSVASRDPARLHRRMLASVRCRPDPARSARLGEVPVVLEVPPGWGRLDSDPGILELAGDGGHLVVRPLTSDPKHLPAIVRTLFEATGVHVEVGEAITRAGPHGPRAVWPLTIEEDGETAAGWVTHWPCGEGRPAQVGIGIAEHDEEAVLAILLGARCTREGEAAPAYPLAPEGDGLDNDAP